MDLKTRGLWLCMFALAGCATTNAEQLRARYREDAAFRDSAAQDPHYASAEGFQGAHWGMSVAQVQAVFPAAVAEDQGLGLDTRVEGRPAHVHFGFVGDRLCEVRGPLAVADANQEYAALAKDLRRKYGKPAAKYDPAKQAANEIRGRQVALTAVAILAALSQDPDQQDTAQDAADGVAQLEAERQQFLAEPRPRGATWLSRETRVVLASQPEGNELAIAYESRVLWAASAQTDLQATPSAAPAAK